MDFIGFEEGHFVLSGYRKLVLIYFSGVAMGLQMELVQIHNVVSLELKNPPLVFIGSQPDLLQIMIVP